jgi:hypothetical protein
LFGTLVRAPSVIIIGADAWAAALPATPIQLTHACMAAGYHLAAPGSWGDELVASAVIDELARRASGGRSEPAVLCACPGLAARLTEHGDPLRPFLISLVAPPVAAALYVRELYAPQEIEVTYLGSCAAADSWVIDVRVAPEVFFERLAAMGIELADQPLYFDSVIPPDRRRHLSLAGGAPSPVALARLGIDRRVVTPEADRFSLSLAQQLLSNEPLLIDAARALGCACAGDGRGSAPAGAARNALEFQEPPRSATPVVDERVCLDLSPTVVSEPGNSPERARPGAPRLSAARG